MSYSNNVSDANLNLNPILAEFVNHKFFRTIQATGFTPIILRNFAEQYWSLTEGFNSILCAAISNLSTDSARLPIVKNLWDEHGEGNILRGHRVLYGDFIRGVEKCLNLPDGDVNLDNTLPETEIYLAGMIKICDSVASNSSLIGILAFCEAIASFQCNLICKELSKFSNEHFIVGGDSLEFWAEHAEHEPEHIRDVLGVVDEIDEFNLEEFLFGAQQSLILENLFWDGIVRASLLPS